MEGSTALNRRYCYWSVATPDHSGKAERLVASARRVGLPADFHVWSNQHIEGAVFHELGEANWNADCLTLLRDQVRKLDHDYFIWLDGDSQFVRLPENPLSVMQKSPLHVPLESNLVRGNVRDGSWHGCPIERFVQLMRAKGVRSRSIYTANSSMFIVHRDFIETLCVLADSFFNFCKGHGHTLPADVLLAYAMHMVCADTERHTLATCHSLWCSDTNGEFANRLPTGASWVYEDPFTGESITVNPAIVHFETSKGSRRR